MPAENLKHYSKEELHAALERQLKSYSWTFFDEREFLENLMCQRFNFLLVFYSVFVAAAASAPNQRFLIAVLIIGTALMGGLWAMIWRAYIKFDVAITICYRLEQSAMDIIDKEARLSSAALVRVNPLLAIWIPLICLFSLLGGAILATLGILNAASA